MVRVRVGLVCFVFTVSIGALAQFEATPGQLVVKKLDYLGTRESSAPREPMIVEQADGVLFVTGYADPEDKAQTVPRLWRSKVRSKPLNERTVMRNSRISTDTRGPYRGSTPEAGR